MSDSKYTKLNSLLGSLGDTTLISSRWLRANGYPSNLLARYIASSWLQSPARGVYMRKGGTPTWDGLMNCLQTRERLPAHVGGRFALAIRGHEHYLRLGEPTTLTLYGAVKLPAWVYNLPLREPVQNCGTGLFDWADLSFNLDTSDAVLAAHGLERLAGDSRAAGPVCSTPERAILELCDAAADSPMVHEVNELLQGLATLRPQLVSVLLHHCTSIKAKRLFMALAHRTEHAWLAHLNLKSVYLGRGNRSLFSGGKLDTKYQITLPADLNAHLG